MAELIENRGETLRRASSASWLRQEDWWAIWIGLGLVAVAVLLVASGGSIKWIAVAPAKWSHLDEAFTQLRAHASQYLALYGLWAVLLGIGTTAIGFSPARFLPVFTLYQRGPKVPRMGPGWGLKRPKTVPFFTLSSDISLSFLPTT